MKKQLLHTLLPVAIAVSTPVAFADHHAAPTIDPAGPDITSDDRWEFNLVPYVWVAGIDGSAGGGRLTADLDIGFDDTLANLEGGLIFAAEARKGRFGARLDFLYLRVGGDAQTPGGLFGRADVEVELSLIEPSIAWRLYDSESSVFDVYAGARIIHSDLDIRFSAGRLPARSLGDNTTTVDPIIGMSARQQIAEDWFLFLRGDIGGFGVTSDFQGNMFGGVGYDFTDSVTGYLGYRYLNLDIPGDRFDLDAAFHGVALGLGFRF